MKIRWKEGVKDKHVNLTESIKRLFYGKHYLEKTNAVMASRSEWLPNHRAYTQHTPQALIGYHPGRPIVYNMGQERGLLN